MLRTRSRLARAVRRTRAKNAQAGTGRPGHADLRTAGWHGPSRARRFKNRRLRRVISGTRLLEHLRLRRLITSAIAIPRASSGKRLSLSPTEVLENHFIVFLTLLVNAYRFARKECLLAHQCDVKVSWYPFDSSSLLILLYALVLITVYCTVE